jgi:hypothetical protein
MGIYFYGWRYDSNEDSANSNVSLLDRCFVSGCQGHAFYFRGSDANASSLRNCSAQSNWGWGFYDNSQYGQHFHGCHAATNGMGAYYLNDSADGTVLGCYAEQDQGASFAGIDTVVVGGTGGNWKGRGLILLRSSRIFPRMRFQLGPDRTMDYHIGNPNNDQFLSSVTYDGRLLEAVSRLDNDIVHYVSTQGYITRRVVAQDLKGTGMQQFERGMLLGNTSAKRRIVTAANIASLPSGTYEPGDVIFDSSGTVFAWVPSTAFGVQTRAWTTNQNWHVGEVHVNGANAYVVSAVSNGLNGRTGCTEPTWDDSVIVDNQVTWTLWGSSTPSVRTVEFTP